MGTPRENARVPIVDGQKQHHRDKEVEVTDTAKKLPVSQQVVERLDKLKFCPVAKLVDLAKNAQSEYVQLEATKSLFDKVAPSLKSVEIDGNNASNAYTLNIFYHKHSQEIAEDPFNKVLGQIKPFNAKHDS